MNLLIYFIVCVTVCTAAADPIRQNAQNSTNSEEDLQALLSNGEVKRREKRASRSPRYRQPFMVAIIDRFSKEISCGGAIINSRHVLTASHCFHGLIPEDYLIIAGVKYLDKALSVNYDSREIESVRLHEHFRRQSGITLNDIAVVTVTQPFNFNELIQPIPMGEDHAIDGMPCTTIGWGIINTDRDQPNPLKEFEVTVIEGNTCASMIQDDQAAAGRDVSFIRNDIHNLLCVTSSHVKPCQGDSGGPLICNNELHGVVAFGSHNCARDNFPTVFTRVTAYRNWIG